MIPYATFLYFGVLLYVVVPTLVVGIIGRTSRYWALLATVAMLVVQYGHGVQVAPGIEIRELWIVAGYALFEWAVAVGFLKVRARGDSRWPFRIALFLALLPLVVAKLAPLIAPNTYFGFLGISYVTFRSLDVIICSQDRLISSLPPSQFFAYLFFFGTISSGPIDRYRRFETDWNQRRTRAEFLRDLDGAVHRTFKGFFYKFVLAVLVKQHWLDPAAAQTGFLSTLSYMYAYSFYLFFDFAGYSAFAIAVSYLFGIHTPENFNRPFLARNIRDFWNRWHITLSWWLRDHVYMRFVMAATKGRWFKSRYLASSCGLLLAFGLMGLWHGPAPHYLLYGLYHGILVSSYEAFVRWNSRSKLWGDGPLWQAAGIVVTFHCVCFGFLLFSGHLPIEASSRQSLSDASAHQGRFEKAGCDEIAGWAWDARNPQSSVNVEIYIDNLRRATVLADLYRADLAAAGKGDGAHGFVYILPRAWQDGRPHSVEVRIAGHSTELEDSARSIICEMSVQAMDRYEEPAESPDSDPTRRASKQKRPASFVDNRDGTITDLGSGLMWEKKIKMDGKVDAANLNDADNCYPWAGKCATGAADCRIDNDCGANRPCQAGDCQDEAPNGLTIFKWVERLNAVKFAGYDNWRIPNSEEIYSIVNPLEEGDPVANTAFEGSACGAACTDLGDPSCSCAQPGLYWAAPAAAPRPDESWMMYFYCTDNLFLDLHANRFFVRAVRHSSLVPVSRRAP